MSNEHIDIYYYCVLSFVLRLPVNTLTLLLSFVMCRVDAPGDILVNSTRDSKRHVAVLVKRLQQTKRFFSMTYCKQGSDSSNGIFDETMDAWSESRFVKS
jgi:hypothetical protein